MGLLIKKILKKAGLWDLMKGVRDFYYKISKKNVNKVNSDGSVKLPKAVTIELTVKCNLNCKMCPQKKERKLNKSDYNFNDFCRILDNLSPRVDYLSFIGGEIFVHPDIFKILEECQKRGIRVHLSTNATLLNEEKINRLRKLKKIIKGIGISIDGLPATHNSIRNSKTAFERTAQALKMLAKDFNVSINTVLFKENLEELIEMIKIFKKLGVQNFSWQFEVFATPEEILASSKILNLPLEKICVEEKLETEYDFSYDKVRELLKKVAAIKGISFMVQPRIYNRYPELYFKGRLRQDVSLGCKDLFACRVDSQGNVIFCPAIKVELGNLLEQPLNEIWNNENFKRLRLKLLANNLTPICKRCCRLG